MRACPPPGPRIRLLRPGEQAIVDEVFAGLSPRSRYLRFHAPLGALPAAHRRALVDVDGRDHIALVAVERRPLGIARLIRTGPAEAEVSVAVVDDAHRNGVARRLLAELERRACAAGVRELHANVLAENTAALALFRASFAQGPCVVEGDVLRLTCLPGRRARWPARPGRPGRPARRRRGRRRATPATG
ncbi:GNAT family N-acetyltransferase [Parafrankia soli]|uniref:GNAT family N-acetyltransferase n=1 Tax=Parafrankia soli TaxID=2599596 RepID=UPI001F523FC1|nr:GNAT family N-acetyltransferase [Parafrankia soli]